MAKLSAENAGYAAAPAGGHPTRRRHSWLDIDDFADFNSSINEGIKGSLFEREKELLQGLVHSIRTIRCGSIVLTVQNSQLVEINKSVRSQKRRPTQKQHRS
jgi:hypothetical protein